MTAHPKFFDALAASQLVQNEIDRFADARAAERARHIATIARVDGEAERAWPAAEARKAKAAAARDAALKALRAAEAEMGRVYWAVSSENAERQSQRTSAEDALLRDVHDDPDLAAFFEWLDVEMERVRRSVQVESVMALHGRTGKKTVIQMGNGLSVRERLSALVDRRQAALDLRVQISDIRDLPARLEALKRDLPEILSPQVEFEKRKARGDFDGP